MQIWFDRQGQPIDATRANELLGDTRYVRVAMTHITSSSDPAVDFDVSTVWLGCNHAYLGGPPILFETMVFGGNDDQDQTMWRYHTEAEAIAGHQEIVASVAATVTNEIVTDEVAPAPLPERSASVLDRIDDVLADWHGSADSMHWSPDEGPSNASEAGVWQYRTRVVGFAPPGAEITVRDFNVDVAPGITFEPIEMLQGTFSLDMSFPIAEPDPELDYWAAQAWRRIICKAFDVPPRAIGFTPRYGLDARYTLRQRNRRKRR